MNNEEDRIPTHEELKEAIKLANQMLDDLDRGLRELDRMQGEMAYHEWMFPYVPFKPSSSKE